VRHLWNTWTNPAVHQLEGPDNRPLKIIFDSLTDFLRRHIGQWGYFTGTTNAGGLLTVTHGWGVEPGAILVTHVNTNGGATHNQGPIHIESFDANSFTVHFLKATSGNNDALAVQEIFYHILPRKSGL